jgi:putative nucleotidyltransferase with HDIG domain
VVRTSAARDLAWRVIGGLESRWLHTAAVVRRAEDLFGTIPEQDRDVLVSAAWLHDIGYGDLARDTGFHPLDGARLLDRRRWPARISALVAQHSAAAVMAPALGLAEELSAYPDEASAVSDALTYADQTTGYRGERLCIEDRLADMLRRHGPDSPNARVHHLRAPLLLATAERVERRLHRLAALSGAA